MLFKMKTSSFRSCPVFGIVRAGNPIIWTIYVYISVMRADAYYNTTFTFFFSFTLHLSGLNCIMCTPSKLQPRVKT